MSRVAIALCLALSSTAGPLSTDGIKDNDPNAVRRIPAVGIEVPDAVRAELDASLAELQKLIQRLRTNGTPETSALLPDILIFERAVRVALEHDEFFSSKDPEKAKALLAEGIRRAEQLAAGKPRWMEQTGLLVRGYISRIDNTVQPYGLVIPNTYAFSHSVPTRCDIWFHGRGERLNEVNFLWERMQNPGQYTPEHTIVLHPYGRYSNAFKFAGEKDVLEALADVQQRYRIDEDRISVRGFSMGGAACWQFAVHYSDRWFAANPGAGFSETPEFLRFFQKEALKPTAWERSLWNLYDCNQYARNLIHCPVIAYSGAKDIQKQAADVMADAMLPHDLRLRHVIGANMGHRIDDHSKMMIDQQMARLEKRGRQSEPTEIHFQTHTLKYNRMHWLTVDGLQEHWKPAQVDIVLDAARVQTGLRAEAGTPTVGPVLWIDAANVSGLTIEPPILTSAGLAAAAVEIHMTEADQEHFIRATGPMSDGSHSIRLQRDSAGKWAVATGPTKGLRKRHNLQGPIDDAFMDSFVFVRPTGQSKSPLITRWVESELERAIEHWRRHFRGDARVVADTDVTEELIEMANLILWGDPSSNQVLNQIHDALPITCDGDGIRVGNRTWSADDHALISIYPNPLNPQRYVVLNSSFTFRDYAYLNNARQVPMLPDWAIVDLHEPPGNVWPGRIVAADFFDELWQLKPSPAKAGSIPRPAVAR